MREQHDEWAGDGEGVPLEVVGGQLTGSVPPQPGLMNEPTTG